MDPSLMEPGDRCLYVGRKQFPYKSGEPAFTKIGEVVDLLDHELVVKFDAPDWYSGNFVAVCSFGELTRVKRAR